MENYGGFPQRVMEVHLMKNVRDQRTELRKNSDIIRKSSCPFELIDVALEVMLINYYEDTLREAEDLIVMCGSVGLKYVREKIDNFEKEAEKMEAVYAAWLENKGPRYQIVSFDDYWWVVIGAACEFQKIERYQEDFSDFYKRCCYYSNETHSWIAENALTAMEEIAWAFIGKEAEWCLPFLENFKKEVKRDWLRQMVEEAIETIKEES